MVPNGKAAAAVDPSLSMWRLRAPAAIHTDLLLCLYGGTAATRGCE